MSIDKKDLDRAAWVYAVVHQQPVRVYVDNLYFPITKYAFLPIYSIATRRGVPQLRIRGVPKGLRYYYNVGLEEAEKGLCQQPTKN